MALGGGGSSKASASAIKAGEAFLEIYADDSRFVSTLKGTANKLHAFGSRVKSIGFGAAAAGATVLAPLTAAFRGALKFGDQMTKASERMGATAEAASKLAYAAEQSDTALEAVVIANTKLTKSAIAASEGAEEQVDALAKLGLTAQQFLALDADERFARIAETLEKMEDPLEQNTFLFGLLGKSAVEMLPLLRSGGQGIRDLFEEAGRVGAVVTSETAAQSTKLGDTIDRTWKAVKTTVLEVGFALLGLGDVIESSSEVIVRNLARVREWIKENRILVVSVFAIGAGLLVAGGGLAIFGIAIQGIVGAITTLISVAAGIVGAVFTPLGLISAAIGGLIYLFVEFTEAGQAAKAGFMEAWQGIGDTFKETLDGIKAAMAKGDMEAAAKIAWIGIQLAFQQGVLGITKAWNSFKSVFVDGWNDIVAACKIIFFDFMAAIAIAFGAFVKGLVVGAAWLLEQVGADETAGKLKEGMAGFSPEAIKAERDKIQEEIIAERVKQQAISDAARRLSEAKTEADIARLKAELAALVAEAKTDLGFHTVPKPPPSPPPSKMAQARLADAVAGAFTSRDYKGILGVGPASSLAKDSLKVSKDQLKVLQKIEKKVGPAEFD